MKSQKYKIPPAIPVEPAKENLEKKPTDIPEKKKERFVSVTERLQRPLHERSLS